jgi:lipid II:glycine glycyltransferase (peptidoglycan interpeptide bridge formation enzyme)
MTDLIKNITEAPLDACDKSETFVQSAMWGEFKSLFEWKAKALLIEWEGETRPLMLLVRHLMPGFSFAYVPWGPEFPLSITPERRASALSELVKKLKPYLLPNTTFIRFDPPWFDETKTIFAAGFKHAAANVQPPDTVILYLEDTCDKILSEMKPKWRYNISLAAKKGVQVDSSSKDVSLFYNLLKETAERDGIAVHNFEYYKTLFDLCQNHRDGSKMYMYTATHEGDLIASIVVLIRGKWATYLYGASSNMKRNLMAPYALQWKAIQDAKEAGCLYYDFFGIPPNEDPNHPMAGLYRFKTGFGGKIVHRPGSLDYPYKKFVYAMFKLAEGIRKKRMNRNKNKRKDSPS